MSGGPTDTEVPDLMILIDAETCLPAHSTFHTLYEGEEATLEDLGLMVSYISQTTNTSNYYWGVSDSNVAGITAQNKVVVYDRGETEFTVHDSGSTNTPMYFIVHSPYVDDGTYYIRNWGTDKYIELTTSNLISGETFSPDSSQLWDITYLGSREYSIRSHQSTSQYLAINGDSTAQAALVVSKTGSLTSGMRWTFTKADSGAFRISAQCAPNLYIQNAVYTDRDIRQVAPENSGSQYSEWLLCEYSDQVEHEMQTEGNWCWVTCARMASFKYMKSPISQKAAAYYAEYEEQITQGVLLRTLYPELLAGDPALRPESAAETSQALEYILGWEGCTYYNENEIYGISTLKSLLSEGNVVIVCRTPEQGDGHVYLVYDYSYNSELECYQFDIYDPWYIDERAFITRTYNWIYDGDNAYYSEHKDGRLWAWVVTYRIGDYTNTIRAANEW